MNNPAQTTPQTAQQPDDASLAKATEILNKKLLGFLPPTLTIMPRCLTGSGRFQMDVYNSEEGRRLRLYTPSEAIRSGLIDAYQQFLSVRKDGLVLDVDALSPKAIEEETEEADEDLSPSKPSKNKDKIFRLIEESRDSNSKDNASEVADLVFKEVW